MFHIYVYFFGSPIIQTYDLNQEIFLSVTEARVVIEEWRRFYNRVHPHSGLGFQSPDGFARTMAQLEPVPGT